MSIVPSLLRAPMKTNKEDKEDKEDRQGRQTRKTRRTDKDDYITNTIYYYILLYTNIYIYIYKQILYI